MKKVSKKLIVFIVLVLIFLGPVFLLNLDFVKPHVFKLIQGQLQSKVNLKLEFVNPNYQFKRFRLNLSADEIFFKDPISNPEDIIIYLKNFNLVYPLRNLFKQKQIINKIEAQKLAIKAIKTDNGWNLESILKPSDKETQFIFRSLKFHDTDLEICSNDYSEKENVYLDIHKEQDFYTIEFYNKKQDNQDETNQFYISGDYDLNNNEGVYKYVKNLDVNLSKLRPDLINIISRAFTDRKSRFITLFNKYANDSTELSLRVIELKNQDELYAVNLNIENILEDKSLGLESQMQLADSANIQSFNLDFLDANLKLNGTVVNVFSKKPELDFDSTITNLNPYLFRDTIPELQELISKRITNVLSTIHKSPIFNLDVKINGDFLYPKISVSSELINNFSVDASKSKKFQLIMKLLNKGFQIEKLEIPFEFSSLNINALFINQDQYNMEIKTNDFPLRILRIILNSFLSEQDLRAYKDLVIEGFLKSDLRIIKNNKSKLPDLDGELILAKTSVFEPNIPILMQDISADLLAKDSILQVSNFEGSLYENEVDLNGYYNIFADNQLYKINISSKEFDLSKIESYQIKKYFNNLERFKNLDGKIENLEIDFDSKIKSIASSGRLVNVNFDYQSNGGALIKIQKISSDFAFLDNVLELKDFKAYVNDSSSLNIEGKYDFSIGNETDFKLRTINLPFALLSAFEFQNIPFEAKAGLLNIDLHFNNKKIDAQGDVKDLVFKLDSEKLKDDFRNVSAKFSLDKNLSLNGLTASYGESKFDSKKLFIKDFFTKDKYCDIDLDAVLQLKEFKAFIPASIQELLDINGFLPIHLYAKGDKNKFYLDFDGNLNGIDELKFADWLEYDNAVKAEFKTSFAFTPKLILSRNTYLDLKKGDVTTRVNADFEVHDWKEKNELRYSIDAYTNQGINGDFLNVDLDPIEPHIKSIEVLNLDPGTGFVQCRTDGDLNDRHTFCDIDFADKAIARNFGIGDLTSSKSSVNLISVKDKPVYVKVKLNDGVWKTLEYLRVRFDMEITEDLMDISRLRAKLKEGFIRSNINFNFKTLVSKFKIKGNNIPAHEAADSFFALGHEVPQGTVSGQFDGTTKGLLPDEMFFNLEADASALVRDGKLSSLKTMQKILSAVNTLKNFDFNNVFQTLITYKGGLFNDIVSYLHFDKGKITTEKLLLHSDQIELHLEGFVDYSKDYLTIRGLGAVPERSKSFLQLLGVKQFNLGNLLSIVNLRNPGSKDKDYFAFMMKGSANNLEEATLSLRQNFTWLRSYEN